MNSLVTKKKKKKKKKKIERERSLREVLVYIRNIYHQAISIKT